MKSAGVAESVLNWFKSYLFDRRQLVVLPGATSNGTFIHAGVLQGSILGPLLFLLYINDIVSEIGSNIRLFADDTSLFIVVDNPLVSLTLTLRKYRNGQQPDLYLLTLLKRKQCCFLAN